MAFWVDALRGTLVILIIMIVAGAIAYVGDRVGHQVGRKRLTLFGIRPRYTSTIVAVGTGMIIALAVTLVAIIFSQQVKTALFRMNQISAEITQLQTREQTLESKVNNGNLVQPVGGLMFPYFGLIPKGEPVDQRLKRIEAFYNDAVKFINYTYAPLGLKSYKIPADIDRQLAQAYGAPEVTDASQVSDLLMMVVADQNLYQNDDVHFELSLIADEKRFSKGQILASFQIPAGSNANVNLAIGELQQYVANVARNVGKLPSTLADTVRIIQGYPSPAEMQQMLARHGSARYVLTAYAGEDIYPHTGGIPIVVTLAQAR